MTSTEMVEGFLEHVDQGYGRNWIGLVVFSKHDHLHDWARTHLEGVTFDRAHTHFKWESGERLFLGVIKDINQYWRYHGLAFPYIAVVEENEHWPGDQVAGMLRTINRPRISALKGAMRMVSVND